MFQHLTQPLISALLLKTHLLVVTLNTTLQALPATLLGKESGVSSTIQGFLCSLSRSLSLSLLATGLSLTQALCTADYFSSFKFVLSKPFLHREPLFKMCRCHKGGQLLQDGKNEQTLSTKNIFWS